MTKKQRPYVDPSHERTHVMLYTTENSNLRSTRSHLEKVHRGHPFTLEMHRRGYSGRIDVSHRPGSNPSLSDSSLSARKNLLDAWRY
ncbi:hypothetical protein BC937DRAFT_92554 [Endogone sp. FLAS-F59071]|nr:hypothetical protein BC937DRAFT_92554 [Endogone sp. FLAS-F59071]|eukprot:RUS15353.1 hypothetical protein BC937DRAFT_92554 [Endogone sp. FLAS-F59071]